MMCSIFIADNTNSGKIPTDLKYLDFGKNDFIVCENAMKKYPIVCIPKPNACKPRLIFPS